MKKNDNYCFKANSKESYVNKCRFNLNNSYLVNATLTTPPPLFTSDPSIIYVTDSKGFSYCNPTPYFKGGLEGFEGLTIDQIQERFAPIFIKPEIIYVPKKAENNLRKHIPKKELLKVNPDLNVAVELCLVFLSNLSSTYYREDKYKALHSTYLHDQLKYGTDNTYNYKKIIYVLKEGTKKYGPFIDVERNPYNNETYTVGKTSKQYCLTSTYLKPGLIEYHLTDSKIIARRQDFINRRIKIATRNVICKNLLKSYEMITLPPEEKIWIHANKLVDQNFVTKKGKKLTKRNKHSNSHWKDSKNRTFVEDGIELYNYLTKNGFMIPEEGSKESGGRVVDSFTLMPSWIRPLIKIKGEISTELDYSTLHPNIAMMLYGIKGESIDHSIVANYLGIERSIAKTEHLSFFNKRWNDLIKSPIYPFYKDKYPLLMENLKKDKDKYRYKITSRRLFKVEVEIMTEVIKRLNNMNIFVAYVYDALLCQPIHHDTVKSLMNETAREFKVYTVVK